MECVAMLAASAGLSFSRLAIIQDLNPFVWGTLAVLVYAAAPAFMIWKGADWYDAPLVWISSLGGLIVLFVVQCVFAELRRKERRSGKF